MLLLALLLLGLWLFPATAIYLAPSAKNVSWDQSYDYIIVGGGIGGLVTATRLSEDPSVSILVIEAGDLDDQSEDITVPGNIGRSNTQRYDWNLTTVRQEHLNNETRPLNQGRVIGGSTILNGLCWTRGSRPNFDAWEALGNPGWGWDDMLPYFAKSEKLTTKINDELQVTSLDDQGHQGPLEVGFPQYFYNQSRTFLQGMEDLGFHFNNDPNGGDPTGCSVIPSSMTSAEQSRADPRGAYLEPAVSRSNLHVLTGHTVTRILHDETSTTGDISTGGDGSGVFITGVEFAANATAEKQIVNCRKEVVIAAGAIFSPVLLQVSGLGPRSVLESLDIPVVVDLPGVGRNLQDHPMVQPVYRYSAPDVFSVEDIVGRTRDEVRQEYLANRTGPWTSPSVNAVAFPSLRSLTDDWAHLLRGAAQTTPHHLPAAYDDDTDAEARQALYAGYAAQEAQLLALLNRTDVPATEVMSTSWGRLAVGALQPFSRGVVVARSASVFDQPPLIDPRYCSHPFDCEVLRLGLELNARLVATEPMAVLAPVAEDPVLGPFSDNDGNGDGDKGKQQEDREALGAAVRRMVRTGFHPAGTTAMMPREKGGVVDTALRVYGARNLRVVDAGVLPLIPDGHIQAAIYAVAEKAADIIKQEFRTSRERRLF